MTHAPSLVIPAKGCHSCPVSWYGINSGRNPLPCHCEAVRPKQSAHDYQRLTKRFSLANNPVDKCPDSLDQAEITQDIGYYRNNNTDNNGADDLG